MSFFGPVFQLQWWGMLCPCLENEEDRAARQSLKRLQHVCVQWHPTGNTNTGGGGGVASLVVGFFKKSTSNASSSRTAHSSKNAILAKLLVVDHATTGPTLQITPIVTETTNTNTINDNDSHGTSLDSDDELHHNNMEQPLPNKSASAASFMKCIPLRQVKQVQSVGKEGATMVLVDAQDQTVVRLDIMTKQHSLVSTAERTEVMDALSILLHWVQRCPKSDDEEAAEDAPTRNRAQQAAHFAKREIELQQKKREREKRKAGYLEQSKGLKYTALAMANREEDR
jgi:hypothetical protein